MLSLGMGGQERLVVRMARALRQRGYDSRIVTLSPGGPLSRELDGIPLDEVVRRERFDPSLYLKLWRLFRSLRPDVVHTHNTGPLVYAVPAARAAGTRCIVHTKHGNFAYPRRTLRLARLASKLVNHFVSVSTETRDNAARHERPAHARSVVIENGIPLGAFGPDHAKRQEVRDELGIPDHAKVVGSVGRLVDDKDFPLLVEAMAPLLAAREQLQLVIVGEGNARPRIEEGIVRFVAPGARSRVILTGERHDVPRLLCAFDIFASSSRTEGLPLALPEAMTSGLPIVATSVGGVPGIVPSQSGVLVAPGDPAALRGAIERFLDDDVWRTKTGVSARAYAVERFAEARMVDAYLRLYADRSG